MKFESYTWMGTGHNPKTTNLTVFNIPYSAIRAGLDPHEQWYTSLAMDILTSAASESIFTTVSVHDYVWGYESPFLKWVSQVKKLKSTIFKLQTNNTSDKEAYDHLNGRFDVYYTGSNDTNMVNYYHQWHGMTNLGVWSNTTDADTVKGANGDGFQIGIPENKNLTVFVDTLYRHMELWHNMTTEVQGITLNVYWTDPRSFYNVSEHNEAYHLYAPKGLSNMTGPEQAENGSPVPIFMSLPLFFHSDDSYFNAIEWQAPNNVQNETKHNTEILVEPISGITMAASKRIQVNCRIAPGFLMYPNITTTFFPVAWFELTSSISEPLANKFRRTVYLATTLSTLCPYIMGAVSVLSLCAMVYCAYTAQKLSKADGFQKLQETIQ